MARRVHGGLLGGFMFLIKDEGKKFIKQVTKTMLRAPVKAVRETAAKTMKPVLSAEMHRLIFGDLTTKGVPYVKPVAGKELGMLHALLKVTDIPDDAVFGLAAAMAGAAEGKTAAQMAASLGLPADSYIRQLEIAGDKLKQVKAATPEGQALLEQVGRAVFDLGKGGWGADFHVRLPEVAPIEEDKKEGPPPDPNTRMREETEREIAALKEQRAYGGPLGEIPTEGEVLKYKTYKEGVTGIPPIDVSADIIAKMGGEAAFEYVTGLDYPNPAERADYIRRYEERDARLKGTVLSAADQAAITKAREAPSQGFMGGVLKGWWGGAQRFKLSRPYTWVGSGTPLVAYIHKLERHPPINMLDLIAFKHDLQYTWNNVDWRRAADRDMLERVAQIKAYRAADGLPPDPDLDTVDTWLPRMEVIHSAQPFDRPPTPDEIAFINRVFDRYVAGLRKAGWYIPFNNEPTRPGRTPGQSDLITRADVLTMTQLDKGVPLAKVTIPRSVPDPGRVQPWQSGHFDDDLARFDKKVMAMDDQSSSALGAAVRLWKGTREQHTPGDDRAEIWKRVQWLVDEINRAEQIEINKNAPSSIDPQRPADEGSVVMDDYDLTLAGGRGQPQTPAPAQRPHAADNANLVHEIKLLQDAVRRGNVAESYRYANQLVNSIALVGGDVIEATTTHYGSLPETWAARRETLREVLYALARSPRYLELKPSDPTFEPAFGDLLTRINAAQPQPPATPAPVPPPVRNEPKLPELHDVQDPNLRGPPSEVPQPQRPPEGGEPQVPTPPPATQMPVFPTNQQSPPVQPPMPDDPNTPATPSQAVPPSSTTAGGAQFQPHIDPALTTAQTQAESAYQDAAARAADAREQFDRVGRLLFSNYDDLVRDGSVVPQVRDDLPDWKQAEYKNALAEYAQDINENLNPQLQQATEARDRATSAIKSATAEQKSLWEAQMKKEASPAFKTEAERTALYNRKYMPDVGVTTETELPTGANTLRAEIPNRSFPTIVERMEPLKSEEYKADIANFDYTRIAPDGQGTKNSILADISTMNRIRFGNRMRNPTNIGFFDRRPGGFTVPIEDGYTAARKRRLASVDKYTSVDKLAMPMMNAYPLQLNPRFNNQTPALSGTINTQPIQYSSVYLENPAAYQRSIYVKDLGGGQSVEWRSGKVYGKHKGPKYHPTVSALDPMAAGIRGNNPSRTLMSGTGQGQQVFDPPQRK